MTTKKNGETITLAYEPWNFDRLYSPDGRHHLLLCDVCGTPEWVEPLTEAFVCSACANAKDAPVELLDLETRDDDGYPVALEENEQ